MKESVHWYSDRLQQEVRLVRWGIFGTPVLLFPTAGGDAEECEHRHLVAALEKQLAECRIKLYSLDSIAGRAWISGNHSPGHCAWLQNQFDACVYHEMVPAIRSDCRSADIPIVTAGASIGAFNAMASICRHPDAFTRAICMSGTYDIEPWLHGEFHQDFYYSSPIHFVPNLEAGWQLETLRTRFVIIAFGQGRWESPEQSYRMAGVLGARGVPNRVDAWSEEFDHDWPTWHRMLPHYLEQIV